MERLADDFLKEMNLESLSELEKLVACAMLEIAVNNDPDYYVMFDGSYGDLDKMHIACFTDDMLRDDLMIKLAWILENSSDELVEWLSMVLERKGIQSPLQNDTDSYRVICDFLNKRLKDFIRVGEFK